MRLYRNNRIDQPFELSTDEIVGGFWRDHSPDEIGMLDRALRHWLSGHGAWDPTDPVDADAYEEVFDAVLAAWPKDSGRQ